MEIYVIHSQSEEGYWSEKDGWVEEITEASIFTTNTWVLPQSRKDDARYIKFKECSKKEVIDETTGCPNCRKCSNPCTTLAI